MITNWTRCWLIRMKLTLFELQMNSTNQACTVWSVQAAGGCVCVWKHKRFSCKIKSKSLFVIKTLQWLKSCCLYRWSIFASPCDWSCLHSTYLPWLVSPSDVVLTARPCLALRTHFDGLGVEGPGLGLERCVNNFFGSPSNSSKLLIVLVKVVQKRFRLV